MTDLLREAKPAWLALAPGEEAEVTRRADNYRRFISQHKTERETVVGMVAALKAAGFTGLTDLPPGQRLAPGTRFFQVWRQKALVAGIMGGDLARQGFRLVGCHLDSPRLDLKPQPLYESQDLALLKTHFYGGIKKYQWVSLPLALHGVVVLADGRTITVQIGEAAGEPVLTIPDLLPHLAEEQLKRRLAEGVKGEELNVLAGGIPDQDPEAKERVKLAVLRGLNRRYGLVEEDLISAELELVPAGEAREVGLDASMIGGYGQDDRICSYAALEAILALANPARTALVFFFDKEEVGSTGNTGARSRLLERLVQQVVGGSGATEEAWGVLSRSQALSGDVNAALDPTWEKVMDTRNAARLGYGTVLTKYTGSRGKAGASDAHAEFVGEVRRLFNQKGVVWQSGELGRVDQGGGGTIAGFLAETGMDVLDCGVPILGMHSPYEVASKVDLYMTWKGYREFLAN